MNAIQLSARHRSTEPRRSDRSTDRRGAFLRSLPWVIAASCVVLLAVVVATPWRAVSDGPEHDVVTAVRGHYVELSEATAPDDRIIDAARSLCAPGGLSGSQRAWLASVHVEPSELSLLAQPLCPSR